MSSNDVIDEYCSCGATFHMRGWGPSITNAAKHWRQTHRHDMSTPAEHVEAAPDDRMKPPPPPPPPPPGRPDTGGRPGDRGTGWRSGDLPGRSRLGGRR